MFNNLTLDEICNWQSAAYVATHINEHYQQHILYVQNVKNTEDLLTKEESFEAAAHVLTELVAIHTSKPFDKYLEKYLSKILRTDLQAYLYDWQIPFVWDIPRDKLHLYNLESLPNKKSEWGSTYLWEDLITHFK